MPEPRRAVSLGEQMLAIALASSAILFFQIAVTRVLSVVLWYHWAFLSVSLAMLGLGAPGVWFALRRPSARLLPWTLLLGGLAIPGSVMAILAITLHAGHNTFGDLVTLVGPWVVVACMGCVLVPMLLLGAAVCMLLLAAKGKDVGRLYGADLVGASLASAAVLPVLSSMPTPIACALVGLLPIYAAWRTGCHGALAGLAAAAIVAVTIVGEPLKVRRSKLYYETEGVEMYERWTATARLTFFSTARATAALLGVAPGSEEAPAHAWGRGSKAPEANVEQFWMEQDGTAGTPITRFDGNTRDMSGFDFLLYDVTSAGYEVRPPERVAIIGGGGGRDVLTALRSGATDIDVAEFNPGVVDTVSTRYKEFSGDIYHATGVHAHVSEGRSFLTRSRGDYDLVQISLIDSWAATAAGAYTLAENNLYTVEAFRQYFDKLTDDGLLSTSRWRAGAFGLESDRLVLLSQAALRDAGVAEPDRHLIVLGANAVCTVLMAKQPFGAEDLAKARAICEQRGFELLYPDAPGATTPGRVAKLLQDGPDEAKSRGILIDPSTDDRPFFFQSLPVFGSFDLEYANKLGFNQAGVATLQLLMVLVTLFAVLLFFAPFVLTRWLPRVESFWRGSTFFAAIGLSFMLIEIPWLQRFVLYLGHPSIAAAVVIGALLLGAGIGSWRASRAGLADTRRWWLVPVALAVINSGMSTLFAATLGASEAVRIAITVAMLLPVGFLLGHFFPLGMLRFGDDGKAWFWAVNGVAGVVAGVVSLALAMAFGFQAVGWMGVAGYVAAGLLLRPGGGALSGPNA